MAETKNPEIPEFPFDWTDWAEVPKDFKPMSAERRAAAAKRVKDVPTSPPKAPGQK